MKLIVFLVVALGVLISNARCENNREELMVNNLKSDYDSNEENLSDLIKNDSSEDTETNSIEEQLEFLEKKMKEVEQLKSSTKMKKSTIMKPIVHNGYTLDINVDAFKSTRYCHYNEICKNRYKQYFECLCPRSTLCIGQGSLFEAKCSKNLMPYIWLQSIEENSISQRSKA